MTGTLNNRLQTRSALQSLLLRSSWLTVIGSSWLTVIGSSWLTVIWSSWRRCTGRLFQIVGAAQLNERFAVSVRLLGTPRSDFSDDLKDLTETLSWRSDARYAGSPDWRMLKVVTAILNFIRYSTGSQWSEHNTGRMLSYFLVLEMTRATVFCAICNLWRFASDVPTRR